MKISKKDYKKAKKLVSKYEKQSKYKFHKGDLIQISGMDFYFQKMHKHSVLVSNKKNKSDTDYKDWWEDIKDIIEIK